MGDRIGWMQVGIYHRGLALGETPNIDRIGQEGTVFIDYYTMSQPGAEGWIRYKCASSNTQVQTDFLANNGKTYREESRLWL